MKNVARSKLISTYNLIRQEKDIYLFDIKDFIIYEAELSQYISKEEMVEWNSITSICGKKRFLFRKSSVRLLLGQYLNMESSEIKFRYNRYKKPFIIHTSKNLNFSLSHSKQYLLMGINTRSSIGVDIETNESICKRDIKLFKNYLSKNEMILFHHASEIEQRKMFHRIWVQKEAISKAFGFGLTMDFSKIDLSDGEQNKQNCAKYLIFDKEINVKIIQHVDCVIAIATF